VVAVAATATVDREPGPLERLRARRWAARRARERFLSSRKAEKGFSANLRAVARRVGAIVEGWAESGRIRNQAELRASLERYAQMLEPWAQTVAARMVAEVDRRDAAAWREMTREIGEELARELVDTSTATLLRSRLAEAAKLITSLPLEAAQRVHRLTVQGLERGARAETVAAAILETGHVTESRARLIAATEVARTAALVVEARARAVGAETYVWRTLRDSAVRPLHRALEGRTFRWDDPPVIGDNGERGHPGEIYYCRCFAAPVLPARR
jgi:SPP1 gp7 family putative phage head morphogenesis protein